MSFNFSRPVIYALCIAAVVVVYLQLPRQQVLEPEPDSHTIQFYRSQAAARRTLLKEVPSSSNFGILYNVLVPEVFCKNLVRIGYVGDGGKWVCNPTSVLALDKCTVYSLGIADEPSFEEQFQRFVGNKCVVRSIDESAQSNATLARVAAVNGVVMKARIGSTTDEGKGTYRLVDVLAKFGDKRVDILKIDIEGAEYLILDELAETPMCQILIEVHSGSNAKQALDLLQKLSKSGYYLFSYEINGYYPILSEYSFIHESCLADYQVKTIYGRYLS